MSELIAPPMRLRSTLALSILLTLAVVACRGPSELAEPLAPETRRACDTTEEMHSVYFATGESVLDAHQSRQRLAENAQILADCPKLTVEIRAYVDSCTPAERGSSDRAMELSQARADSVSQFYIQRGVSPSQVYSATGLGADPRAGVPCEGEEG